MNLDFLPSDLAKKNENTVYPFIPDKLQYLTQIPQGIKNFNLGLQDPSIKIITKNFSQEEADIIKDNESKILEFFNLKPNVVITSYRYNPLLKTGTAKVMDVHSLKKQDRKFHIFTSGRGCGKTKAAVLLIILRAINPAYNKSPSFIIFRQNANVLDGSIMLELKWAMEELGVTHLFTINRDKITCLATGVTIRAMGVAKQTTESLKGLVCHFAILEEATSLKETEWMNLIPTIVRQQGCQILILANPDTKQGSFYKTFFLNRKSNSVYDSLLHSDNPYFMTSGLYTELLEDTKYLPKSIVNNKWHGEWLEDGDTLIRRSWLVDNQYESLEHVDITEVFMTMDSAIKKGKHNDYTVIMVWATDDNCVYLVDMVRDKIDFGEQLDILQDLWNRYTTNPIKNRKPSCIIIEDAAQGDALHITLRDDTKVTTYLLPRGGVGKVERVMQQLPKIRGGKLRLPRFQQDITNKAIQECIEFRTDDKHDHDDMVDAMTDALAYITEKKPISLADWGDIIASAVGNAN